MIGVIILMIGSIIMSRAICMGILVDFKIP
jgi:hypothetical protein